MQDGANTNKRMHTQGYNETARNQSAYTRRLPRTCYTSSSLAAHKSLLTPLETFKRIYMNNSLPQLFPSTPMCVKRDENQE